MVKSPRATKSAAIVCKNDQPSTPLASQALIKNCICFINRFSCKGLTSENCSHMIKYFPERIHVKEGEGLGNVAENVIPGFRALFLLKFRSQILAWVSVQEKETSDKWPLYFHSTSSSSSASHSSIHSSHFHPTPLLTLPSSTTPHPSIQHHSSHFHPAQLLTHPSSTTHHTSIQHHSSHFHPAPLLTLLSITTPHTSIQHHSSHFHPTPLFTLPSSSTSHTSIHLHFSQFILTQHSSPVTFHTFLQFHFT